MPRSALVLCSVKGLQAGRSRPGRGAPERPSAHARARPRDGEQHPRPREPGEREHDARLGAGAANPPLRPSRRRSGPRTGPAPPLTPRPPSQRNTIDQVKLSLFQLTDFLNTFEASTKHKLGQLNEKMDRLERQVSHAEGAITAAVDQLKK